MSFTENIVFACDFFSSDDKLLKNSIRSIKSPISRRNTGKPSINSSLCISLDVFKVKIIASFPSSISFLISHFRYD